MREYIFKGGNQYSKIRVKTIDDMEVATTKTNNKYVKMSSLLTKDKLEELRNKLKQVFDEYIIEEYRRMGYSLLKKHDTA